MNKLAYITYNRIEAFLEKTAAPAAKALKLKALKSLSSPIAIKLYEFASDSKVPRSLRNKILLNSRGPVGSGFAGILTPVERAAGEASKANIINKHGVKVTSNVYKNLVDASGIVNKSLSTGMNPNSIPEMMNIKNKLIRYNNIGKRLLSDNSVRSKIDPSVVSKMQEFGAHARRNGLKSTAQYIYHLK